MTERTNIGSVIDCFSKLGESFLSAEEMKKAAEWYIETSEKLAHQLIDLQEKANSWAKSTPFGPLFEAQASIARKLTERSASAARNLCKVARPDGELHSEA
jgi:hypothetical protein